MFDRLLYYRVASLLAASFLIAYCAISSFRSSPLLAGSPELEDIRLLQTSMAFLLSLAGVKGGSATLYEGGGVKGLGGLKIFRKKVEGEIGRGVKRRANNAIFGDENHTCSYFRTGCGGGTCTRSYFYTRRASFVTTAIILIPRPNPFCVSLHSSQNGEGIRGTRGGGATLGLGTVRGGGGSGKLTLVTFVGVSVSRSLSV